MEKESEYNWKKRASENLCPVALSKSRKRETCLGRSGFQNCEEVGCKVVERDLIRRDAPIQCLIPASVQSVSLAPGRVVTLKFPRTKIVWRKKEREENRF